MAQEIVKTEKSADFTLKNKISGDRDGELRNTLKNIKWLFYLSFRKFNDDACIERSASLSYVSIISLIPLLVLFFSIVSVLGLYQEMIKYIHETLLPFVVPEFQDQLIQIITDYISPTLFTGTSSSVINLLAILLLILSATGVLITAEKIFNNIWRVKETRGYVQKITAFWVILTTSPFLILASVWLADYFSPGDRWINEVSKHFILIKILYDQIVLLGVGFIAFTLLLIFTPSTRVKFRAAAVGGIISAILWEVSKKGFYLYIVNVGTVTNFYKQIAMVPLFLVWVFLTWNIILLGAELSYTAQNLQILIREQKEKHSGKRHSSAFLATNLLFSILRSFRQGTPAKPIETIAANLGIRVEELQAVARILVEMKILTEDASDPGVYYLIRNEEHLSLKGIIEEMRLREFPNEAILSLSDTESAKDLENGDVAEAVEYLFAHAERAFMDTFDDSTDIHHYIEKLKNK